MPLPHHEMGRWGSATPASMRAGWWLRRVQRTGDGFLVHHKQSTADLMCV